MRPAAFAIPGDIATVTGGYIYERRLLEGLREAGRDVRHIGLSATFPDPDPAAMAGAVETLIRLDPKRALILDGLVFGAIETRGLAQVDAPVVAMVHHPLALETGLSAERRDHLFITERDNLALATHILVPSHHTALILTRDYGVTAERITVAPPGTDRKPRARSPSDPPLILSVGLQHPRKGHDVLLHALARITDRDWRAVIVGAAHDVEFAVRLDGMVERLNLRGRVHLAGLVSDAVLQDLYAQASVFTLATRYEGYGMVFDEALSWGLPIVSCDTGAVSQTVPPGAGLLVAPDAPDALSGALAQVLDDGALRAGLADQAARAGSALPGWPDTARIAGDVLDRL